MHLIDLVLILIIAVAVFLAVRSLRKKGTCSCGGSCEGCAAKAAGVQCSGCGRCHNPKSPK